MNDDWTAPQNDGLWRDAVKTIFDPCPHGWRVPPGGADRLSPWSAFATDNSTYTAGINGGRQWNSSVVRGTSSAWYSCAGVRSTSGVLFPSIGNTGYYWNASVAGAKGVRLRFDSASVLVTNFDIRHDGYPVRCIRE